jgi:NAD+ synthase
MEPNNPLTLDVVASAERISRTSREIVHSSLRKQGAVVAVSGGIDSAVCAALCVRALGPQHVFALSLPDRHSSRASSDLAAQLCSRLGIELHAESIDPILESAGCFRYQTESLRAVYPDYQEGESFKITLPSLLEGNRLTLPRLTVRRVNGELVTARIPQKPYLQLVASTNFKQRTRAMVAYFHADRLNYAVCGTPNRLEYDQGFFVKGGDGLSDWTPIAHLYKSQVYALGRELQVPEEILNRAPTTDTFPLEQTQEEFYFAVPYASMDLCLYGLTSHLPPAWVASKTGLSAEQVERIYLDIEAKRRATLPLHLPPLKLEVIDPVDAHVASVFGRRVP